MRTIGYIFLLSMACSEKPTAKKTLQPWRGGAEPTAAAPTSNTVEGKVLETMDASTYTYMRLQTQSGETWAAVNQTRVAVGSMQRVDNAVAMDGFESKTLNRKFEHIVFGVIGEAPAAPPAAAPASPATAKAPPAAAGAPIKVGKAAGPEGRTIAELWAQKDALKGKTVVIAGQVVKYTAGVMGKNWLHLRDGTGSDEKKNNDFTVNTKAEAAVGDVVTIKGTVGLDRDFGAGYSYPVIVEDATVTK